MDQEHIASDDSEKILNAIRSLQKDNPLRLQAEMLLADLPNSLGKNRQL